VRAARRTVAGDQSLIHICIGESDARIGERRKIAQGLVEIGPTGDVAPCNTHRVPLAEATQRLEYFGFVGAVHSLASLASNRIVRCALEECASRAQLTQQLRSAQTCSRDELAASPHTRQRLANAVLRENFLPRKLVVLARSSQARL